MYHKLRCFILSGSALLAGCTTLYGDREEPVPQISNATAVLINAVGQQVGSATAHQNDQGITLRVSGAGLPSGAHGLHVHKVGSCQTPDFASAGAHWNPSNRQHGKDNPSGSHAGDLPNLIVGTDGSGSLDYMILGASLSAGVAPMIDGDGAALVIHSVPDDYRTDPSGNSGARIACGIFRPA